MGAAILLFVLLFLLCVMFAFIAWTSFMTTVSPKDTQSSSLPVALPGAEPTAHPSFNSSLAPPSVNKSFLEHVRSRSCYAGLRITHGFITTLGIVALAVVWITLMNVASTGVDSLFSTVGCGLAAAALFIEYGFFRMIVDAVDGLIDTSRRNAGDKGGG
jgi:hypothetical protein